MLSAVEQNGDKIILSTKSRGELQKLRKDKHFYCPTCKEELLLKIGQKRVPHFSHKKETQCIFSKGESEHHLQGKEKLYEWLLKQVRNVEVEKYLPEIRQRADLYFSFYGDKAVIEYQCSTISTEEFVLRTNGYHGERIHVLWIFGAGQLQRIGTMTFKITEFISLGTIQLNERFCLVYFCTKTDCFIVIPSMIPFTATMIYAPFMIYPRDKISFQKLITYPTLEYRLLVKEWNRKKEKYRLYGHRYFYPHFIPFINLLREYLQPPGCFPSEAGIPLIYGYSIKTPPIVWQTYFLLDFFQRIHINETFTIEEALYFFHQKIKEGLIELRVLPLVKEKELLRNVIQEYLSYLCRMMLLHKVENNYEKLKALVLPLNIQQGMDRDKQFSEMIAKALEEGIQ